MKNQKPSTPQESQRKRIQNLMEILKSPDSSNLARQAAISALQNEQEDLLWFKEVSEPVQLGKQLSNKRLDKQLQRDNNKLLADNLDLQEQIRKLQRSQQLKDSAQFEDGQPQSNLTKLPRPPMPRRIRLLWNHTKQAVTQQTRRLKPSAQKIAKTISTNTRLSTTRSEVRPKTHKELKAVLAPRTMGRPTKPSMDREQAITDAVFPYQTLGVHKENAENARPAKGRRHKASDFVSKTINYAMAGSLTGLWLATAHQIDNFISWKVLTNVVHDKDLLADQSNGIGKPFLVTLQKPWGEIGYWVVVKNTDEKELGGLTHAAYAVRASLDRMNFLTDEYLPVAADKITLYGNMLYESQSNAIFPQTSSVAQMLDSSLYLPSKSTLPELRAAPPHPKRSDTAKTPRTRKASAITP